jgi:hypothetical protein
MRRCYEAASLVQHSGKSRLGSSSSRSVSSTLLPSLLLLLLITISLYTWMEKKRLNKQILFLNPHHHHHLLCLWFLFIPPMSEMFSAWLSPPLYQLINGCRWLIYYLFFFPLYRTARPTHKISGRNNVPDSMAYHLKIATTSTFLFFIWMM